MLSLTIKPKLQSFYVESVNFPLRFGSKGHINLINNPKVIFKAVDDFSGSVYHFEEIDLP